MNFNLAVKSAEVSTLILFFISRCIENISLLRLPLQQVMCYVSGLKSRCLLWMIFQGVVNFLNTFRGMMV